MNLFKKRKKPSIRSYILFAMIFIVFSLVLLLFVFFTTRVNSQIKSGLQQKVKQINDQANSSLNYLTSNIIAINNYLKLEIENNKNLDYRLNDIFQIITQGNDNIVNIAVYSQDGDFVKGLNQSAANLKGEACFNKALNSDRAYYFYAPTLRSNFDSNLGWVITICSKTQYYQNNEIKTGVLVVNTLYSNIANLIDSIQIGKTGYAYIIDENNNYVYHPQQQLLSKNLKTENIENIKNKVFGSFYEKWETRERFVVVQTINNTRWRLVSVSFVDEMSGDFPELLKIMIFAAAALLALFVAISMMFSNRITKPLLQLQQTMEVSLLDAETALSTNDSHYIEIDSLYNNFNSMIVRNKNLLDQLVNEQDQKRLYELNALQSQINPHFLYNTLDSIIWMQERGNVQESIKMTSALAKLFRISISRGKRIISVENEFDHVRNYMIIQSMRFKNKFKYTINLPENLKTQKSLKLIIQPVVENAILHGFDEFSIDEAEITLSAYEQNNKLVFKIEDNGMGMNQEKLDSLLKESPSGKNGIGFRNVHQRIQLVFGKEYGLKIESEEDFGTSVYITQPLNIKEEEVNA